MRRCSDCISFVFLPLPLHLPLCSSGGKKTTQSLSHFLHHPESQSIRRALSLSPLSSQSDSDIIITTTAAVLSGLFREQPQSQRGCNPSYTQYVAWEVNSTLIPYLKKQQSGKVSCKNKTKPSKCNPRCFNQILFHD